MAASGFGPSLAQLDGIESHCALPLADHEAIRFDTTGLDRLVEDNFQANGIEPGVSKIVAVDRRIVFDHHAAASYGKVRADLERRRLNIGPLNLLIGSHD